MSSRRLIKGTKAVAERCLSHKLTQSRVDNPGQAIRPHQTAISSLFLAALGEDVPSNVVRNFRPILLPSELHGEARGFDRVRPGKRNRPRSTAQCKEHCEALQFSGLQSMASSETQLILDLNSCSKPSQRQHGPFNLGDAAFSILHLIRKAGRCGADRDVSLRTRFRARRILLFTQLPEKARRIRVGGLLAGYVTGPVPMEVVQERRANISTASKKKRPSHGAHDTARHRIGNGAKRRWRWCEVGMNMAGGKLGQASPKSVPKSEKPRLANDEDARAVRELHTRNGQVRT